MDSVALLGVADIAATTPKETGKSESISEKVLFLFVAVIIFIIVVGIFNAVKDYYFYNFAVKYDWRSEEQRKEVIDVSYVELKSTMYFAATAIVIGLVILPVLICAIKYSK